MTTKETAQVIHFQRPRDAEKTQQSHTQSDFLASRIAPLSKASRSTENPTEAANPDPRDYEVRRAECIADCESVLSGQMARMALRQKYRAEADSHKNMLTREKDIGRKVAPEWRTFARCLMSIGPCPGPGLTIDRLQNSDPEYAPGKVDWRTSKQQANNRSNTVFLEIDGEKQPATIWEKRSGTPADTIRKRLAKGWSDREAVYGRLSAPAHAPAKLSWFGSNPQWWEDQFQKSGTAECRLYWYRSEIGRALSSFERRLDEILGEEASLNDDPDHQAEVDPCHADEVAKLRSRHSVLSAWRWRVYDLTMLSRQSALPDRDFWEGLTSRCISRKAAQKKRAAWWAKNRANDDHRYDGQSDGDQGSGHPHALTQLTAAERELLCHLEEAPAVKTPT